MDIKESQRMTFTGKRYPDGQWRRMHIENGRIVAEEPEEAVSLPAGVERWIVPGFFDIQVNGFGGRDFLSPQVSVEDVEFIARAVLATGVTRFLPTIITAGLDDMCRRLAVIARAIDAVPLVRQMCPGIHVEGPFIHPEDGPRGAHPREHVREPSIKDFERLYEAAGGKVALLTLAPERPGAVELIRHATALGIIVALGHHRADAAAIDAAIAAGAKMSTHLGNATDALLPRHDNYVWQQLGEDRLWASFISDGHHLPAATLRCMLRAKTPGRSILITDAVGAAGMPPGRYLLGEIEVERTPAGRVILPGTPYQAGSAADMPTVIGRAVVDGGVSLIEAVTMASIQPASLLARERGFQWSCLVGHPADMVEFEWQPANGRITICQIVLGEFTCIRRDQTA